MPRTTLATLLLVLLTPSFASAQLNPRLLLHPFNGNGINKPVDVVEDAAGNVFVANEVSDNVMRVEPDGTSRLFLPLLGDGLGQILNHPADIQLDSLGRLYVAGQFSNNVFRVDPDGSITVVLDASGSGTGVTVVQPTSLAVDAADNVFVGDQNRVFRIDSAGTASIFVDTTGVPGGAAPLFRPILVPGDGAGDFYILSNSGTVDSILHVPSGGAATEVFTAIGLNPSLLDFDGAGNMVVAANTGELYRITPGGVSTFLVDAPISNFMTLAVHPDGRIWFGGRQVVQTQNFGLLLEIDLTNTVTPLPIITTAGLRDLHLDAAGTLFFLNGNCDISTWTPGVGLGLFLDASSSPLGACHGLRRMADGSFMLLHKEGVERVETDASTETILDETANGLEYSFLGMNGLAVSPLGDAYVSGKQTDNVLRIDGATGTISTVIDGAFGGTGHDLEYPEDLVLLPNGDLYVAGSFSDNVFRIEPDGTTTMVLDNTGAGPGQEYFGNGKIAVDTQGTLYASGSLDNLFRVTSGGTVTNLNTLLTPFAPIAPFALATDSSDNLYFSDLLGDRVFRLTPGGVVTEIIGPAGDGLGHPMLNCQQLRVDSKDRVYAVDYISNTVFRVTPSGDVSAVLDSTGANGSPLSATRDVAFDGYGSTYICARASNNVFRIAAAPEQIALVYEGQFGVEPYIEWPENVATDDQDRYYVSGAKDNILFRFDGPATWPDLGGGVPGAAGTPELVVRAPLTAGSVLDRRLENLPPQSLLLNWIAATSMPFPFLGGTVHAFPFVTQIFFVSDADGRAVISVTWPPNIQSGVDIYLQFLVDDPSVPGGIGLSNAVVSTTP